MSINQAMQIGRSALAASQIGMQVAGNNLANAATPGFSRQVARFLPSRGDSSIPGVSIGSGVLVRSVQRQVDSALQGRLWSSASDLSSHSTQSQIYSQIEATLGELGDHDLSSQLSTFFNAWSERGNQSPSNSSVVQQGDQLAGFVRNLRSQLQTQRTQIDQQIGVTVDHASQLLSDIAGLNQSIAEAEVSGAPANTLRDQRDSVVNELSSILDVTVVDHGQQGFDVLVGSTPVVLGNQSRGLQLKRTSDSNGDTQLEISTIANNQTLTVSSGSLGALMGSRLTAVSGTIDKLDNLSSQLIFEVNKLHSTGVNASGLVDTTGTLSFGAPDRTRALNDVANTVTSGLPFHAVNGGFVVNVRDKASGNVHSVRINVDLDGINNAGVPGTTDDTSAQDIANAIAAVPGLSATFTSDGKLQVKAASGFDFSFSDDTSGAVALMGLNSYFTGTDGSNIAVRSDLLTDPGQLTAGRMVNGSFVENGTALEIAGLQDKELDSIDGRTLQGLWRESVQAVGGQAAAANNATSAASVVFDSLDSQRAAISGVSIDEESINLMDFQRQYQAAAKIISTADQMTQTLMQLI